MNDSLTLIRGPRITAVLAGLTGLICFVVGLIVPYGSHMAGYRILPSQSYVADVWPLAVAAAFGASLAFAYCLWSNNLLVREHWFMKIVLVILAGFMGMSTITTGVPILRAVIASETVTLPYRIGSGLVIQCSNPITFEGLPPFFNSLCNVRAEVRTIVASGETIMVSGRGSIWGIFPASGLSEF